MGKKANIRVRVDFDNCRLFDEKLAPDKIDEFTQKVKKKLG